MNNGYEFYMWLWLMVNVKKEERRMLICEDNMPANKGEREK
jgi:hypothetical protein